jgi:hypothetical protein
VQHLDAVGPQHFVDPLGTLLLIVPILVNKIIALLEGLDISWDVESGPHLWAIDPIGETLSIDLGGHGSKVVLEPRSVLCKCVSSLVCLFNSINHY